MSVAFPSVRLQLYLLRDEHRLRKLSENISTSSDAIAKTQERLFRASKEERSNLLKYCVLSKKTFL